MFWSASLREKSPYAPRYILLLYILILWTPSLPLLPLLFLPAFSTFTIPLSHHSLTSIERLHAWSVSYRNSCSLFPLYISLFLCPGRYHPVSPPLGFKQLHRTAPCETKPALVESVTISLVDIPLTSASVISSASTIANVEGVRFSHGPYFPNTPGFGRRERNKIAHPDRTQEQALLQTTCRDWVVTSANITDNVTPGRYR